MNLQLLERKLSLLKVLQKAAGQEDATQHVEAEYFQQAEVAGRKVPVGLKEVLSMDLYWKIHISGMPSGRVASLDALTHPVTDREGWLLELTPGGAVGPLRSLVLPLPSL
jgi:hypothetical protein